MIVAQVSMKAVDRTMTQGRPLASKVCSAACLARNSPTGWPGDAPTTETRTNVAPTRAAADHLHPRAGQVPRPNRVSGHHPHRLAICGRPRRYGQFVAQALISALLPAHGN
jgi:hypothetical protein